MEFSDESLIDIMAHDSIFIKAGISKEMIVKSVYNAMKNLEERNSEEYKIQNAIVREKHTKQAALIAEKEARELIEQSLYIRNKK
tara:strand:+ start:30 stop:284 length:255 start_codon:yes stop_codon:yes gene_type:complete